jgi:iron(III) transport system substrate-binding protein
MKTRQWCARVSALSAASLLLACSSGAATQPGGDSASGAVNEDPGCIAVDDPLVQAAKDEGSVVMSGPPDPNVREQLPAAFEDRYGVQLDYIGGRGSEIAAKLQAERQAGIYSQDVFVGGAETMANVYYKSGWLASLKDLLPAETLAPDNWVRAGSPWVDPDESHILKLSEYVLMPYALNTDELAPSDAPTWKDLLDPSLRGKFVMDDPRVSGGAIYTATMLYEQLGEDFVRDLYVGQEPTFMTDARQEVDALAQGKFAVAMGTNQSDIDAATTDGLPVEVVSPEGGPLAVTSGFGLLAVADRAPHPNAAKLLASWLACSEGNAAWNEAYGTLSARSDVELEVDLPEYQHVDPDAEYFDTNSWGFLTGDKQRVQALLTTMLEGK